MNHRWLARGVVALLHLALLAALWLYRPAALPGPAEKRLTTIRLIEPAPNRPPPAPPTPARQPLQPLAELRLIPPPTFTTEAAPPPEAPTSPVASPLANSAEPPRSTLRLTLPPGYAASTAAARNPALSDARSNTPRRTLEDRIADAAAATGDWVSERTSDSRTLMRKGDTCVEVLRSRIADSDPFNSSVAPRTVPMFGKPYKCK